MTGRSPHSRLASAAAELGLMVHTEGELAQPTRYGRSHAIDHIASRHPKQAVEVINGAPHSTHDAYVVVLAFTRTPSGSGTPPAR